MDPRHGWERLEARLRGALLRPGQAGYAAARRLANAAIEREPAAIVTCAHANDAIEAVRFAARTGLRVTVRGGGQHFAGRALRDGALGIDLSQLRSVVVDAASRVAWAAGGATYRDVAAAASPLGLIVPGAFCSATSVTGHVLAGGSGWLARRFGLGADALRSAQVVFADGRLLNVSAGENPRLFWALRGGGGSLGVVTRTAIALQPAPPLLAAAIWVRGERAAPALRAWRALVARAPDELGARATLRYPPALAGLPESLRDRPALALELCWCGEPTRGEAALETLRNAIPFDAERFERHAAGPAGDLGAEPAPTGTHVAWRSRLLRALDDATLAWIAARAGDLPTRASRIELIALGGAAARGPDDDAARVVRDHALQLNVVGAGATPAEHADASTWVHAAELGDEPAVPVGYACGDDPFPRASFPDPVRERLLALKRDLDPGGLFA